MPCHRRRFPFDPGEVIGSSNPVVKSVAIMELKVDRKDKYEVLVRTVTPSH